MDVGRVGDRDVELAIGNRVGHGDDPLEHVQRDLFRRFLLDGDDREVDEGQVVAGGERAGDAVARGDALVDDRLGQRAGRSRAAADERELVGGDQAGRGEQVGDELGGGVDVRVRLQRFRGRARLARGSNRAEDRRLLVVELAQGNPSNELSADRAAVISTFE